MFYALHEFHIQTHVFLLPVIIVLNSHNGLWNNKRSILLPLILNFHAKISTFFQKTHKTQKTQIAWVFCSGFFAGFLGWVFWVGFFGPTLTSCYCLRPFLSAASNNIPLILKFALKLDHEGEIVSLSCKLLTMEYYNFSLN